MHLHQLTNYRKKPNMFYAYAFLELRRSQVQGKKLLHSIWQKSEKLTSQK